MIPLKSIFRRQFFLPAEHGAWVFLLGPLATGLALGRRFTPASGWLILAAFSAFLLRQPVTIAIKVFSKRRPRSELRPALFWAGLYGLLGLVSVMALLLAGGGFTLWLALPAGPVFAWHLWLVSRRA